MNLLLTYIFQSLTFFLFIWFCMKFVKPPIAAAMKERQQRIADGLSAAEKAMVAQKEAEAEAEKVKAAAKVQAEDIIEIAKRRAEEIIDDANVKAEVEGERIITQAHSEIEVETNRTREALRREVSSGALDRASAILRKEVDADSHAKVLAELVEQI